MSPYLPGALPWLEDEPEPDPEDAEAFTTTSYGGWWSAPAELDD